MSPRPASQLSGIFACLSVLFLALSTHAQFPPETAQRPPDPEDPVAKAAEKAHAENLVRHAGNLDFLVLPGLVADRKNKSVRLWAKSTGIGIGEPIEFFVIPPDSGKDYEALFVAFTKPSDVHKAIEFLGVSPGHPVRFEENRFWPKGERVFMSIKWDEPLEEGKEGAPVPRTVRAEDLIIDLRTSKPLPRTGLAFTGSFLIQPEDGGPKLYAADVADPRSIASNYNDRGTVLDLPRQAPQSDVYGRQKANPQYRFKPGQPVEILLEPEHKDGTTRIRQLSLHITASDAKPALQAAQFIVKDVSGKALNGGRTMIHAMAEFEKLVRDDKDPYVSLHVDPRMPLPAVRELYKLISAMDNENGIRVEPPADGELFYRAFFPNEQWRDRTQRLGRPWELHLSERNGKVTARLDLPADEIDRENGKQDQAFQVGTPEECAKVLAEKSDRWSQSVYIFAPPSLSYGQLLAFIRPGMKTHPTMWVFPTMP